MTAAERAASFNAQVAQVTREVVAEGIACCGAAYWTEDDHHCPDCPTRAGNSVTIEA